MYGIRGNFTPIYTNAHLFTERYNAWNFLKGSLLIEEVGQSIVYLFLSPSLTGNTGILRLQTSDDNIVSLI